MKFLRLTGRTLSAPLLLVLLAWCVTRLRFHLIGISLEQFLNATDIIFDQRPSAKKLEDGDPDFLGQPSMQENDNDFVVTTASTPLVGVNQSVKNETSFQHNNRHVAKLFESPIDSLPGPLQVLREYIEQHGVQSQEDFDCQNKKYMMLSYSFPNRAGNFFSSTLNAMVLAMLTNRTLLFRFGCDMDDHTACHQFFRGANWIQKAPPIGTIRRDCDFRTWKSRGDVSKRCVELFNTTVLSDCRKGLQNLPDDAIESFGVNVENRTILAPIRGIYGCLLSDLPGFYGRFDAREASCRRYLDVLLGNDLIDQQRMDRLHQLGVDFVYGMLFRHAFEVTEEFSQSVETSGGSFDPHAFSVAVHSRHAGGNDAEIDLGDDIKEERECLDAVFASSNYTNSLSERRKCQLLIMSDREATNEAISKYAKERGCEGITVRHTKTNTSRLEHGPFAGMGFWRDMALAAKARHGFVGTTRSSSFLLLIQMVYDRAMDRWNEHREKVSRGESVYGKPLHGLDVCYHQYEIPLPPGMPATSR